MTRGPLAEAVEGLAGDQEVLEQEEQTGGRGDARPPILAREAVAEDRLESEAFEESVEDRSGTDSVGAEGAAGGAGGPPRSERWRALLVGSCRSLVHETLPRWPLVFTGRRPIACWSHGHDGDGGGKVKGQKILNITYVDRLDVSRAALDLRRGACRKSPSEGGA
jgi:hypothetical protein